MRRNQFPGSARLERSVEGALGVRVQVVAHQDDLFAVGVASFQQAGERNAGRWRVTRAASSVRTAKRSHSGTMVTTNALRRVTRWSSKMQNAEQRRRHEQPLSSGGATSTRRKGHARTRGGGICGGASRRQALFWRCGGTTADGGPQHRTRKLAGRRDGLGTGAGQPGRRNDAEWLTQAGVRHNHGSLLRRRHPRHRKREPDVGIDEHHRETPGEPNAGRHRAQSYCAPNLGERKCTTRSRERRWSAT